MPRKTGKLNNWERAICSRVKKIRESINWPQPAFANRISITRDQLASIEAGRTPLRYEIAWNIRIRFDISLRWLESGEGFADSTEHDNLPIPPATGLPKRALLSEVAKKLSSAEDVVSIEPSSESEVDSTNRDLPDDPGELFKALSKLLEGKEKEPGVDDIENRVLIESLLRIKAGEWMATVPSGQAYELLEKLTQVAGSFINSFPAEPLSAVDERSEKIMWERVKSANAKKFLIAAGLANKDLTASSLKGNTPAVKSGMSEIEKLIEAVKRKAAKPGLRAALARELDVAPARISEWLSGKKEPGGDYALRLLHWVEQQERQK